MNRIVLLLVTLFATACNPFGCGEREERYFTEIHVLEQKTEITFNRKLSECVNGIESDDFAWQPIQVDEPTINGIALRLMRSEYPPTYASEERLDPMKATLSFRANGGSYISDSPSLKHKPWGAVWIQMKPLQPN